jgi:hypothetical protein
MSIENNLCSSFKALSISNKVINKRLINHIEIFKKLSNYNPDTHISDIFDVKDFVDEFSCLKFGNGGSWCRFDSKFTQTYKLVIVYRNSKIKYSWKITEDEEILIKDEINKYREINTTHSKSKRGIHLIKINGLSVVDPRTRKINKKIRDHFKDMSCVVCGNNHNTEIDHKNGLYNDIRVLNIKDQTINDFQVLCRHCNLQKRQSYVWMKKT